MSWELALASIPGFAFGLGLPPFMAGFVRGLRQLSDKPHRVDIEIRANSDTADEALRFAIAKLQKLSDVAGGRNVK